MSVTVNEKDRGRTPQVGNTAESIDITWIIRGATNSASALDELHSQTPTTQTGRKGTLTRQNAALKELSTSPDAGYYEGVTTYALADYSTGQTLFTFDTTGGTQNVKYSKATSNKYPSGAPDLSGAINVTASDVAGVDITIAQFGFTATKFITGTNVSQAYIGTLFGLTGKTNDNTWAPTIDGITLSFATCEALFLGAAGSRRGGGDFEVNFHFAGSPNATNLTVGGITGIAKKGWEYLWVRTVGKDLGSGTNKVVVQQALHVYVERVYDEGTMTGTTLT